MPDQMETIKANVIDGRAPLVAAGVKEALDAGVTPDTILHQALIPAMTEVGALFERQEFYVPEMLIAARAMQAGLAILKPLLAAAGVAPIGKAAVGSSQGDLHDIGKNLVAMMLEGAGFDVVDLGTDVAPERFVEAARDGAQIIGVSSLLTTTMSNMPAVVQALETAGLRDRVKVIVGGAPVTQAFADRIGADGYAPDASAAVALSKRLLGAA
jgi:5-methyltetrahydrofolate--homocysteine methyltransferase